MRSRLNVIVAGHSNDAQPLLYSYNELNLPQSVTLAGCAEGRFRPDLPRKHGLFLLVFRNGSGGGFREHGVLCGKDGEN